MESKYQFLIGLGLLCFFWATWSLWDVPVKKYFKSKTGLGILKGVVIALLFAAFFALIGCKQGTYFNDASVYFGLDHTKNISPQCMDDGADNRTTSNLGLRGNVYRSDDQRFFVNGKYTHHSCAFNEDRNVYDALGAELEYKFWER